MKRGLAALLAVPVLSPLAACVPDSEFPENMEARTRAYYSAHLDEARELIDLCTKVEASGTPASDYPVTFSKNCIAARIAIARAR